MRQVFNDLLTSEELEVLKDDLALMFADTQVSIAATYHSTGTWSDNKFTGTATETPSDNDTSIRVLKGQLNTFEQGLSLEDESIEVYLIQKATLDTASVTPKLTDYIVISSIKKYITDLTLPTPGIHYRIRTNNRGAS